MATYTPNLNLYKPDDSDNYKDFRSKFNENMDKIDQGGGGSTYTAGDGIDITNDVISLAYLAVVDGAVNLVFDEYVPPTIHLIEYLESTGAQCIDTGILLDNSVYFDIDYSIVATTSYSTLIGVDEGGSRRLFLGVCSNGINRNYFYCGGDGGEFSNSYNAIGVKTNAKYTTNTLTISNANGTITRNVTSSSISNSTRNLFLYALNRNGNKTDYSKIRIYGAKITKGGELVADLVPAKDENDIPCMYDYVTETYIYNSGTGSFVGGPDIN